MIESINMASARALSLVEKKYNFANKMAQKGSRVRDELSCDTGQWISCGAQVGFNTAK